MRADEMFKKLGYTKENKTFGEDGKPYDIFYYDDFCNIQFSFDEEDIYISSTFLTMSELKAIIKKCNELGWL